MFINLSNHPHSRWQPTQVEAAERYGEIVDLPFPQIPPQMTGEELDTEVDRYDRLVMDMIRDAGGDTGSGVLRGRSESVRMEMSVSGEDDLDGNDLKEGNGRSADAVMLQGEMTFTFRLVTRLKADGVLCLAACSERKVEECVSESGEVRKVVVFEFAGFREY